jgi:hypothetical protein
VVVVVTTAALVVEVVGRGTPAVELVVDVEPVVDVDLVVDDEVGDGDAVDPDTVLAAEVGGIVTVGPPDGDARASGEGDPVSASTSTRATAPPAATPIAVVRRPTTLVHRCPRTARR